MQFPRFTDTRAVYDSQLVVTDADMTGSSGNRPGWRVADAPLNRQAIADARAQYDADLTNAWKTGAGERGVIGERESDLCTIDGRAGHLRNVGGRLQCVPDGADDACRRRKTKRYDPQGRSQGTWETEEEEDYDQASDHRTVTVDALQARRDAAVAPARESMIAETANAWRRNK